MALFIYFMTIWMLVSLQQLLGGFKWVGVTREVFSGLGRKK